MNKKIINILQKDVQIKKVENYKLEKLLKKIKPYIKMNKIFDETKI